MICPRLELLEGPMAVGAVSGSAAWSRTDCAVELEERARCRCRCRCNCDCNCSCSECRRVQRLLGGMQSCTQKEYQDARVHMRIWLNCKTMYVSWIAAQNKR